MLTSKQRSELRAIANDIQPIFQIGKQGITEETVKSLCEALEARELIKITVLKNADVSAKDIINEIAEATGAEPVSAIGSKIVLYKPSKKHPKIVL